MSKPQYSFCLAVVRKHTLLGFTLHGIHLVVPKTVNQSEREIKSWARKNKTFNSVSEQISVHMGMLDAAALHPRTVASPIGDFHLWAIVPVLFTTNQRIVKKLSQFDSIHDNKVYNSAEIDELDLVGFFRRLCTDFNMNGGGNYILRADNKEVPPFS